MRIIPDDRHGLSCKKVLLGSKGTTTKTSTLEQVGICRDSQERIDGLTRQTFKNEKYMCLTYITWILLDGVTSAFAQLIMDQPLRRLKGKKKKQKYVELAETCQFGIFAVDTTTVYSLSKHNLISGICSLNQAKTAVFRET